MKRVLPGFRRRSLEWPERTADAGIWIMDGYDKVDSVVVVYWNKCGEGHYF
ncbi:MAG: hypothetical protein J7K88_11095 [Candidatus Fermentibacteraceae bacterium]|nr:hypothetical protein [Candidatus Fermentibacteraceae bacterium]